LSRFYLCIKPQGENLRQAVGFGSEAHRNRYDCPTGIYAEGVLLGAPEIKPPKRAVFIFLTKCLTNKKYCLYL